MLADRWRNGIAGSLVGLAVIHFIFPGLAIDAVTLGLIAFAGLVKLFDIDSIEWLGIKARKSDLLRKAEQVRAVPIPTAEPKLAIPPTISPEGVKVTKKGFRKGNEITWAAYGDGVFSELEIPTVHRSPADLMPPVDKVDRLYWSVEQIRIELIVLAGNSGHLRSYLSEVRNVMNSTSEMPSEISEWLQWADAFVNRIDPLLPTPAVPGDPKPPERSRHEW